MRKKYLSALLFGALLFASAGTFTSCKDYDDDINNLQGQIDQQASLTEKVTAIESSITSLQSALTETQTAVKAAQDAVVKAQESADAAALAAAEAKEAAAKAQEAAIAAAKADLESVKAELVELIQKGDAANKEAIDALNVSMVTAQGQIQALMVFQTTTEETLKNLSAADSALAAQIGELETKVAENAIAIGKLEAAITAQEEALNVYKTANDAEVTTLKGELASLKETVDALKESSAEGSTDLSSQIAEVKTTLTTLNNQIAEISENLAVLYTAVYEGIAGVSLIIDEWYNGSPFVWNGISLESAQALKTWNFGEGNVDEPVSFVKGERIKQEYSIMFRVSPANATVNPENIQLIDSKGNDLVAAGLVKVKEVKAYDDYLTTRGSVTSNGLYNVAIELGDSYTEEAWANAIQIEEGNTIKNKRFALSIKCDYKGIDDATLTRNVVSEYAMYFNTVKELKMQDEIGFTVASKDIKEIRNRADDKEYVWKDGAKADPIYEGSDANVQTGDYRNWQDALPVVANQPFTIQLDDETMKTATHFYVVVDYSRVSTTDDDSELIAWKAIEEKTTGLNTMYSVAETGGKAEISINYDGLNDEIGFRVYAVNSDGTLVDPDGRSFYVQVGEATQEITAVSATVNVGNNQNATSGYIPVSIPSIASYKYDNLETKNKVADSFTQNDVFFLTYYDADKTQIYPSNVDEWKSVKYVKVTFNDILSAVDDYGYKGKLTLYGNNNREVATLDITATKKLPTTAPSTFSPKTNQIVDGLYTCYLLPEEGITTGASEGIMDLSNVFNGLSNNNQFVFTFANADKDTEGKLKSVTVTANTEGKYILSIGKDFIGKDELHLSKVTYNYGNISTRLNEAGDGVETSEHKVTVSIDGATSYNTKFACVYDVQTWAWINKTNDKTNTDLQYGKTDGNNTSLTTARIQGSNSYDNVNYGKTLDKHTYLKFESAALYSKKDGVINLSSKNEYFRVNVDSEGKITFTFNSTSTTPTADVPSVLRLVYKDMFGHEEVIDLDMTVKK